VDVRCRFGSSSVWAGVSYAYARTLVAFDAPSGTPGLPSFSRKSKLGGLGTSLALDSVAGTAFTWV
jgi:hypothetical protein